MPPVREQHQPATEPTNEQPSGGRLTRSKRKQAEHPAPPPPPKKRGRYTKPSADEDSSRDGDDDDDDDDYDDAAAAAAATADDDDEDDDEDDEYDIDVAGIEEPEIEEKVAEVQEKTTKTKRKKTNGEISKTEAYRRAFLPHLSPLTEGGLVRLDIHDPDSFSVLQIGDTGRDDTFWNGTDDDWEDCRARLEQNLRRQLKKYKAQAQSPTEEHDRVVADTQASRASRLDVEKELAEILASMPRNTSGALGRREFHLDHLDDMAAVTADDLKRWIVYAGWLVYEDGTVDAYVGSSIAEAGSGWRLVHDYEMPLQHAREGRFHSMLGCAGFARHAADPSVVAAFIRPLNVYDIPDTKEERKAFGKVVHFREGVYMDYMQTLKDTDQVFTLGDRKVVQHEMALFSKAMAPEGRTTSYGGLNSCHPVAVGYDHHLNKNQQALRFAAAKQGNVCPIDGQDLTVWTDDPGIWSLMGWSPLKDKVDWCPHEVLCGGCKHWLIDNEKTNLPKAIACESLGELTALRAAAIGSKKPKMQAYEKDGDTHCPACQRAFVQRDEGVTREAAVRDDNATPRGLNAKMKTWSSMQGFSAMCVKCFNQLSAVQRGRTAAERAELGELEGGCNLERVREMLTARAQRNNAARKKKK